MDEVNHFDYHVLMAIFRSSRSLWFWLAVIGLVGGSVAALHQNPHPSGDISVSVADEALKLQGVVARPVPSLEDPFSHIPHNSHYLVFENTQGSQESTYVSIAATNEEGWKRYENPGRGFHFDYPAVLMYSESIDLPAALQADLGIEHRAYFTETTEGSLVRERSFPGGTEFVERVNLSPLLVSEFEGFELDVEIHDSLEAAVARVSTDLEPTDEPTPPFQKIIGDKLVFWYKWDLAFAPATQTYWWAWGDEEIGFRMRYNTNSEIQRAFPIELVEGSIIESFVWGLGSQAG